MQDVTFTIKGAPHNEFIRLEPVMAHEPWELEPGQENEQVINSALGAEWHAVYVRQTAGISSYLYYRSGGKKTYFGTPEEVEAEIRKELAE